MKYQTRRRPSWKATTNTRMNINMNTPMCTSIRMRMKTRRTAMNTNTFIHMNMTMNTVTRIPMTDKRMTTGMNMPKTTDRMITHMRTITKNLITINTNKRDTMSAQTIVKTELFQKCLDFHGHLCPGLSFGYQAAMAGMEPSVLCDKCKEPTMGSKLEPLDGQSLCRGCLAGKKPH